MNRRAEQGVVTAMDGSRQSGSWQRSLPPAAFAVVALAAFGGPLALAALYAPALMDDTVHSSGWVTLAGAAVFVAPLAIWLRYARDIASAGGLFAYVEAAAGRRIALLQAALWTGSYLLYVIYTTAYVVYDILPIAVPDETPHRRLLLVLLPIGIALILAAGRAVLIAAIGIVAIGQLALTVALDVVTVHAAPRASAFTASASVHDFSVAGVGVGALFICGSLPLFLGGELRAPTLVVRRILPAAFAVTVVVVLLAVYPYARHPAYVHGEIPGMTYVENASSHGLAVAIGLGVAASVVGVMLVEALALTRLVHAVTGRRTLHVARGLAVAVAVASPFALIDPARFYDDLLRPSLVLLWLSQLMVVVVFPWFVRRSRALPIWLLVTAIAAALMGYELYTSARGGSAT